MIPMPLYMMETQVHREMAQVERGREMLDDISEEQFLKELYLYMRKRDTPIERIPHLGFKQIDLFVMFKTVRDLGGYHQVTAQQLWKQIYNRLGGNPRSTSAATCTRRHYEKLLLPFECHKKGIIMSTLTHYQTKLIHNPSFSKDGIEGQRPAKARKMDSDQSSLKLHSDLRGIYPMSSPYPPYYTPAPTVLPPYVPMSTSILTSHSNSSFEPRFQFCPPHPDQTDRMKQPLDYLRQLAEQYKTSTGLAEPLNLSVKARNQEPNKNPASSFAPPSSSKNPKFLNKPFPLYTPHPPPAARSDGGEVQNLDADVVAYPYPVDEGGAYVIDLKAESTSNSPKPVRSPSSRPSEAPTPMVPKPGPPQTDFMAQTEEDREDTPEEVSLDLGYNVPSLPQDNEGKMEIKIPLSMFQTWLRLYGSSGLIQAARQLHMAQLAQLNSSDQQVQPTNLSLHPEPSSWNPAVEDLRSRPSTELSSTPTIQTSDRNRSSNSPSYTSSYKPSPAGGVWRSPPSREVYAVDDEQEVVQSYGSTKVLPRSWGAYDKDTNINHAQARAEPSAMVAPQDFSTSKPFHEDPPKAAKERAETTPPAMLMVNSNALLHLTNEEVMKLRKIISSSS